ncbi:tRNA lysidine(34) synthetase TilS [Hasllibacter sp. MH4015]|uniref:tRNA lysidine(34) synthetase TilS n=1 Tax=Hasllibacter sp. MH4015 TaxID=2854029 RepID=UPI001CD74DEA|nr:tRNA lysidine(34) synthetase TilS [Hasllibacter sp. MH4015]
MGQLLGPHFPELIGLAVSGGGDSMAMLTLAHDWARRFGVGLHVVSVDHGLRPESAAEAALVARECASLGHSHDILRWTWDGEGNLQDAARRARLSLIDGWRGDIRHVLFAHTQDDVAETFLMRLARGSGVDGLSAMAAQRHVRLNATDAGFTVIRPLLTVSRAALRHHIDVLKVPYVDDPSNDDPRFDRVKARAVLSELGIDTGTLADTARRMERAGTALRARAAEVARHAVRPELVNGCPTGSLLIERGALGECDRETQMRLLSGALRWVASAPYRPRAQGLEGLLDRVLGGGGGTLHGAQVSLNAQDIRVFREYEAVKDLRGAVGTLWDRRWVLDASDIAALEVAALGPEGWRQIAEKPADTPPHAAALALPAVFDGTRLVACPALGFGSRVEARFRPIADTFTRLLESR